MPKIIAEGRVFVDGQEIATGMRQAEKFVQPFVGQVLDGVPVEQAFENMIVELAADWLRTRINRDFRLPPYFHRPNTNRNTRRRMILAEKRRGEIRRATHA